MSQRTKKFDGKLYYSYGVAVELGCEAAARFLRNRNYSVRTTADRDHPGYREIWTRPQVKG